MTPEQAAELRKPFPVSDMNKLPKLTCKACREKNCNQHRKSKCKDCGNYISEAHMHLDYVGHAALTDRLLQVDPEWNWEPMSVDQNGAPAFDGNGGMWIRLTLCGVTRPGYGDGAGKRGGDAVKEAIGDALRNAGMRFGLALDLWRKEPLQQQESTPEPESVIGRGEPPPDTPTAARKALAAEAEKAGLDLSEVSGAYKAKTGRELRTEKDSAPIREFASDLVLNVTDFLAEQEAKT